MCWLQLYGGAQGARKAAEAAGAGWELFSLKQVRGIARLSRINMFPGREFNARVLCAPMLSPIFTLSIRVSDPPFLWYFSGSLCPSYQSTPPSSSAAHLTFALPPAPYPLTYITPSLHHHHNPWYNSCLPSSSTQSTCHINIQSFTIHTRPGLFIPLLQADMDKLLIILVFKKHTISHVCLTS